MEKLVSLGVPQEQIVMLWPNKTYPCGDLTFRAVLAVPFGNDDLTHVGYILSIEDGPAFYFTGDTAYHEVIGITVAEYQPEVMFTVINSTFRNLSPAEAALLARQIQPRWVIPYHYDLFPDGQMPPQTLRMNLMLFEMQDRYRTLTPGMPWVYT
jgi:L-ascorbate 6-phosphate lactonase